MSVRKCDRKLSKLQCYDSFVLLRNHIVEYLGKTFQYAQMSDYEQYIVNNIKYKVWDYIEFIGENIILSNDVSSVIEKRNYLEKARGYCSILICEIQFLSEMFPMQINGCIGICKEIKQLVTHINNWRKNLKIQKIEKVHKIQSV